MRFQNLSVFTDPADNNRGAVVRKRIGEGVTYETQYEVVRFNHRQHWNSHRMPGYFATLSDAEAAAEREARRND